MFLNAKRGTPGRRATRWLNDEAVAQATIKSADLNHQLKFLPRLKRIATALALAS
jgi:hypothetical protein